MTQRLAIFIPSLVGGGAERVAVLLANAIADRGISVDLLLYVRGGVFEKSLNPQVRIVTFNVGHVRDAVLHLMRYLRQERPSALLSFMTHSNVVAVAARALARSPTRLVLSERNNISATFANKPSFRNAVLGFMVKWLYRYADAITAVSGGVAEDLTRYAALKDGAVTTIYNPAQVRSGPPGSLLPPPRGAPIRVLAAGRLVPQKDFATLLRAFRLVRLVLPAELIIIGEGWQRPELEALAKDLGIAGHVRFPGFVDDVAAWISSADLFVLSSAWEGFANVLLEAMASGVKVVSTDCPSGPSEILEGGKWGRIVPVGDVEAMATAIKASLAAQDPVPDVKRRAADFSVKSAVDQYLAVLNLQPDQG